MVALHLLGNIAKGVRRALAVELVDRDEVREVEHVDLLELARRAVLRRHHIQAEIHLRHDRRVALADARGLDDDDIKARDLAGGDRVRQRLADFAAGFTRGKRPHVDAGSRAPRVDRVHADAIAEQRAAALAARRIDRDQRDAELVTLIEPQAAYQLIRQRTLPSAPGARDTEHGHLGRVGRLVQRLDEFRVSHVQFERADHPGQCAPAPGQVLVGDGGERGGRFRPEVAVALGDHQPDHSLQSHLLPVFRREDARDAIVVQFPDFRRDDDSAATAIDANAFAAALPQQVEHVPEELDVPALVARHRDALHVFLQRGGDDLLDRAVVPEMDHLRAHALQDAPHDVDAGVVAVEE